MMPIGAEDPEAFRALDEFVRQLELGRQPHRQELLRRFPQLAPALQGVETLTNLTPRGEVATNVEGDVPSPCETAGAATRGFGSFELLGEIGRGGMGVVYKARQKGLDRIVAVKMILSSHLASAEHVCRFQAEARAAARLRHANIVQIYEVGEVHGQHYFTMEYVEGESLAQRIRRGPLDVATAVRILTAVARAVEHSHQHGIVHRDLKPSNILIDATEQPYVSDFGLAKVLAADRELTGTGVIAGTPSYMSPEQAAGRTAEVGPASDVYCLGAILYELLTGSPPFHEENPMDTLLQVLRCEPVSPRKVNSRIKESLELVCLKCLNKSPAARYPSAAALADDLDRFARGETLAVRPPHLGQRCWRWAQQQPALALRLVALGIFYLVECVDYGMGNVDRRFHWEVSALVAVWAAGSVACQRLQQGRRWSTPRAIPLGWTGCGVVAGHIADWQRRGQSAGRRLLAVDRRFRIMAPCPIRLVHDGLVTDLLWHPRAGLLPISRRVAARLQRAFRPPHHFRGGACDHGSRRILRRAAGP